MKSFGLQCSFELSLIHVFSKQKNNIVCETLPCQWGWGGEESRSQCGYKDIATEDAWPKKHAHKK